MSAHIYMGAHLTEWSMITMHMFLQLLTNCMMTMHFGDLISSHTILNIVYVYVHVYEFSSGGQCTMTMLDKCMTSQGQASFILRFFTPKP